MLPKTLLERPLSPHETLDLKDVPEIRQGEGIEKSRGLRRQKMVPLTFPGHAHHPIQLKYLKILGEESGVSLRL